MRRGTIVSINVGIDPVLAKESRKRAVIGHWGLEEDRHNRPECSGFPELETLKPNTGRHITILAQEVIYDLNARLGLGLAPGSLGENITTLGFGDLSDIPNETLLIVRDEDGKELAAFRVTEQNKPCKRLSLLHRMLPREIYGRRGLLCAVERGFGSVIMLDDVLELQQ